MTPGWEAMRPSSHRAVSSARSAIERAARQRARSVRLIPGSRRRMTWSPSAWSGGQLGGEAFGGVGLLLALVDEDLDLPHGAARESGHAVRVGAEGKLL